MHQDGDEHDTPDKPTVVLLLALAGSGAWLAFQVLPDRVRITPLVWEEVVS
jgi:hypothetical protein